MASRRALPLLVGLGLLLPALGAQAKKERRSKPRGVPAAALGQRTGETRARAESRVAPRAKPKRARRGPARDLWPPMTLEHVNTKEKLTVRLFDRRGRTLNASVRQIRHLMRCHHTGREHAIQWRLISNLYRISRSYPGRTLRIFSGYRSPRVASLRRSRHTTGRAVDFAVDGIATRALRDHIQRTVKVCGLGYYPNSPFVHFDTRDKPAFWVDYSGKGEEPRYAQNPFVVLERERRARAGQLGARSAPASTDSPLPAAALIASPATRAPQVTPDPVAPASQPAQLGPPPVGPAPGSGSAREAPRTSRGPVSHVRSAP